VSYVGIERRRWPRIPAAALANVSVSILAGPDSVKVIDLSCGGALLEVAARFPLKATVKLRLTQPGAELIVVEGRVARAKVAALVNGVINYRFAVIFDRPLAAVPGVAAGDQHAASVAAATPSEAPKSLPVAIAPAGPVAGERTLAIVPARPVAVPSLTESDDAPIALRGDLERERSRLEKALADATAELARLSTVNQSLAEKLEKSDELGAALRGELEKERSRLSLELAAATGDLARESTLNESLVANLAKSNEVLTGLRHELAAERSRLEQELAAERTRLEQELAAERSRLEQELAAATADMARQLAVIQSLTAKLESSDALLTALHDELQAERGQWEEDRSTLLQQVADAVTVADALQSAQELRELQQAQTLAEQRDQFEAIIAELMTSTNAQQTEYEQLVEELKAAADDQRRRADQHEAELARERASGQRDRADAETRRQDLETRIEAAEALCGAHDARHLALRQQLDVLVGLSGGPLSSDASRSDQPALFETEEEERTRAIA
jgi:hypothetical protein